MSSRSIKKPRLVECFQYRAQRRRNGNLDDSILPEISLDALIFVCSVLLTQSGLGLQYLEWLKACLPRKTFDGIQLPMVYCCIRGRASSHDIDMYIYVLMMYSKNYKNKRHCASQYHRRFSDCMWYFFGGVNSSRLKCSFASCWARCIWCLQLGKLPTWSCLPLSCRSRCYCRSCIDVAWLAVISTPTDTYCYCIVHIEYHVFSFPIKHLAVALRSYDRSLVNSLKYNLLKPADWQAPRQFYP